MSKFTPSKLFFKNLNKIYIGNNRILLIKLFNVHWAQLFFNLFYFTEKLILTTIRQNFRKVSSITPLPPMYKCCGKILESYLSKRSPLPWKTQFVQILAGSLRTYSAMKKWQYFFHFIWLYGSPDVLDHTNICIIHWHRF